MRFELFESRRPKETAPMVTVRGGSFYINQAAYFQFLRGAPRLLLLYDKERGVVGFKPTTDDDPRGYRLQAKRKGSVAGLSLAAFLRHFGLGHEGKKSIPATWNEVDGLMEIYMGSQSSPPGQEEDNP